MNKKQLDGALDACRKHAPDKMVPLDTFINFGIIKLQQKTMRLAVKGYTDEEISEIVKPDVEILNKMLERRKRLGSKET